MAEELKSQKQSPLHHQNKHTLYYSDRINYTCQEQSQYYERPAGPGWTGLQPNSSFSAVFILFNHFYCSVTHNALFYIWTDNKVTSQNGTDKMVAISIDFNSIEYIFSKNKLQISDKPKLV